MEIVADLHGHQPVGDALAALEPHRVPRLALPGSSLRTSGVIEMREEEPRYDLQLSVGDGLVGALQWIPRR